MTDLEMLKIAVKALDEKKGLDLKVIKVENVSALANYFVLVTGTSSTQVKTLADEVEHKLKHAGVEPGRTEGYHGANWIILDYIDVVIHIFYTETREFYDLERLWQDGEEVDTAAILGSQDTV
ncbi:MAG: ribosome silencing factor [Oscillospiraceae bacterium]|nr:ribosome silencing factor [Oscillospiraceae bacterium]